MDFVYTVLISAWQGWSAGFASLDREHALLLSTLALFGIAACYSHSKLQRFIGVLLLLASVDVLAHSPPHLAGSGKLVIYAYFGIWVLSLLGGIWLRFAALPAAWKQVQREAERA